MAEYHFVFLNTEVITLKFTKIILLSYLILNNMNYGWSKQKNNLQMFSKLSDFQARFWLFSLGSELVFHFNKRDQSSQILNDLNTRRSMRTLSEKSQILLLFFPRDTISLEIMYRTLQNPQHRSENLCWFLSSIPLCSFPVTSSLFTI